MNDAVVARWLRDLATMTPGYRQSHLGFAAEIQHYLLQVAEAIETDHLVEAQCSICGKRAYGERSFAWLIPEERDVNRCDDCQEWLDRARERAKDRAAMLGSAYR